MEDDQNQVAAITGREALLAGKFTEQDLEAAFGYVSMMHSENGGGYQPEAEAIAKLSDRSVGELWEL